MNMAERVRACYQHATLRWVSGARMSYPSLRSRFGVDASANHTVLVSRIIKATMDAGQVCPADPQNLRAGYLPWWA